MQLETEVAVIGGGLVGISIGYGLALRKVRSVVLDEGDSAIRASRGNFGLVWVQGKGLSLPAYTGWAMRAAECWPEFASKLRTETDIDVGLTQNGGLYLCRSPEAMAQRGKDLAAVQSRFNGRYDFDMLDHVSVRKLVPEIGTDFAGASYSRHDGQANPLRLLHALHRGYMRRDSRYLPGMGVLDIKHNGSKFVLTTSRGEVTAECIVLASGLGNVALGGGSWEEVGHDLNTTFEATRRIAADTQAFFPFLRDVRIIRSWAALRIITPDAAPVYEEVVPGAFLVTCHSGVSLAAIHAFETAGWIADGGIPDGMRDFSLTRFTASSCTG